MFYIAYSDLTLNPLDIGTRSIDDYPTEVRSVVETFWEVSLLFLGQDER